MSTHLPLAKYLKSLLVAAVLALGAFGAFAIGADGALAGSGGLSAGADKEPTGNSAHNTQRSGGKARGERRYKRIWRHKVSRRNKRWAKRTSLCESGRNPKAIGGGGKYRGAFQFLKSTWRASPKSPGGDPIRYGFKTQAVVAVALKRRDGAHHWPNCG